MQKWTRWQDWVAVVAGAYGLLSPIWTSTTTRTTWTMVVLGVLTVAAAAWSLAMPDSVIPDGAVAVLGVLFFISPWVMGFSGITAMAWTAWIVGAVSFIAGVWTVPDSQRLHHMATSH